MPPPVVYFLITALISATMSALVGLLGIPSLMELLGGATSPMPRPAEILLMFMFTMLFAVPGLFLVAGITHAGVRLFGGGANRGYEATLRVLAYSSVVSMFAWIPFVGWLAYVYGIVLEVIGIRELHGMSTGNAITSVVVLPLLIGLVFGCIGFAFATMFLAVGGA